jgi:endoglucanase
MNKSFMLVLLFLTAGLQAEGVFIRYNYVGYNPAREKKIIVMAERKIDNQKWIVKDEKSKPVMEGSMGESACGKGDHAPMPFNYTVDISNMNQEGIYFFETSGADKAKIIIRKNPYTWLVEKPLRWFRVARSGSPDCLDHKPGHFGDTSCAVFHRKGTMNSDWTVKTSKKVNAAGGWYDAGDYLKFTLTIAYADYFLLRAYETAPEIFTKKLSTTEYVDVLDEAKWGLDYLMKCMPDTGEFIIEVGNNDDHNCGCRLPADDTLDGKRPALSALSPTQMGYAAASLALGSAIFAKAGKADLAKRYLSMAELIFRRATSKDAVAPAWLAIPEEGESFYDDDSKNDNLELAAAELYRATKDQKYLEAGKKYADLARSAGWRAWESMNIPAHLRLLDFYPIVKNDIRTDMEDFQKYSTRQGNLWGVPLKYVWAGLYCYIGIGSGAFEYTLAAKDARYQRIGTNMLDYLMGVNNWGTFFIAAREIPGSIKHPYSQIYTLQSRLFPDGAISEGPGDIREFEKEFPVMGFDNTAEPTYKFNTVKGVFYDNKKDYMCMETCINGVADGIYLLAVASKFFRE